MLILGAGEMSELTARALADQGVRAIFVANRNRQRAIGLAQQFGGQVVLLDELPAELERADIVVAATASPHTIVHREELELVMAARGGRPLLVIDIAVPRDVDADCGELDGVTLFDIDDLQRTVARNRSVRAAEARRAEGIVEQEIRRFADWFGSLAVLPTLTALRERANAIARQVVAENANRWEAASERDRARAEAMVNAALNKLLHEPTERMRHGELARMHAHMQVLRELFALEDPAPDLEGARPSAERRGARAA